MDDHSSTFLGTFNAIDAWLRKRSNTAPGALAMARVERF
jgi:hypothetical protein